MADYSGKLLSTNKKGKNAEMQYLCFFGRSPYKPLIHRSAHMLFPFNMNYSFGKTASALVNFSFKSRVLSPTETY